MTDWNSLHTLLAVASTGSYADAARSLGIDETTVSRRIRALERDIGRRLLERGGRHLETTPACRSVLQHLKDAESALNHSLDKLSAPIDTRAVSTIRITSVDYVCDRLLAPMIDVLTKDRNFRIELVGDDRNLNLRKREADIALRLAKPTGDLSHACFIADIEYSAYQSIKGKGSQQNWAALDTGQLHLQEVRWSEKEGSDSGVRYTATSLSGLLNIVETGVAIAFLPKFMAEANSALQQIPEIETRERPLWMIWHSEFEQSAHFNTVKDRIVDTLQERLA